MADPEHIVGGNTGRLLNLGSGCAFRDKCLRPEPANCWAYPPSDRSCGCGARQSLCILRSVILTLLNRDIADGYMPSATH